MKIIMPILKTILEIVTFLLAIIGIINLYNMGYKLITNKDMAGFLGLYSYRINEDNLSPDINKNDFIIFEKNATYMVGDYILYRQSGQYKVGEIIDNSNFVYMIKDNKDYKLTNDNIVGKSIFKINKFGKIYDAIISPFMLVIVVIGMIIYFILTPERN